MTITELVDDRPPPAGEGEPAHYPRILGDLGHPSSGHTLLCIAGLHGNEPAGVLALKRIFRRLEKKSVEINGRLVGLAGNRQALAAGRRFLTNDLNRIWTEARISNLEKSAERHETEAAELMELNDEIERILNQVTRAGKSLESVYSLDLHTTSGPGPAFAVLNDTLNNRRFAQAFPVPVVLGLEEELGGTLATYLGDMGVRMLGFESGQHDDPIAVEKAEAAIWIAIGLTGLLARDSHAEIEKAWESLSSDSAALPALVEVRHRHYIGTGDGFQMRSGFESFRSIREGTKLGFDNNGPVLSPSEGMILMPLYQDQGEDGFFLVRRVHPAWLKVSTVVRMIRLERVLHWFPGVRRHPELETTFVVNRGTARWLAPQLFHLLGFRRLEADENRLTLTRRRFDA